MVRLDVYADGFLIADGARRRCALGRAGVVAEKREGDGATPAGCFALRRVHYRADRGVVVRTGLPVRPIRPNDGWCDDPGHPAYNRLVELPFAARHERLARNDGLYDLVVEIGHNDDPPEPGAGSAIFLHIAEPNHAPTEGCVALARDDLVAVIALLGEGDEIRIHIGPHLPPLRAGT